MGTLCYKIVMNISHCLSDFKIMRVHLKKKSDKNNDENETFLNIKVNIIIKIIQINNNNNK